MMERFFKTAKNLEEACSIATDMSIQYNWSYIVFSNAQYFVENSDPFLKDGEFIIAEFFRGEKLLLKRGESITYLGFSISNSKNHIGIVMEYEKGRKEYGSIYHLGNFGLPTSANIMRAKKYALTYYMAFRPNIFARILVTKLLHRSYIPQEYFTLLNSLKNDKFDMPIEITTNGGFDAEIFFNGEPLTEISL